MAKKNYNGSYNNKKSKYSEMERLAFKMGSINRAVDDGVDCKVLDSFAAGSKYKDREKKVKKPLF